MPSWPIHLALANDINKKLNLGDEFIVGNVLPDVLNGFEIENPSLITDKDVNHFQDKNNKPPRICIDKFIDKYGFQLNNSLFKGYLAHLITDKYFNEYTYKKHYFFDGNKFKAVLKDGMIYDTGAEKPWQIKQADFKIFDQKLINEGMMPIINDNLKNVSFIEECPVNESDLSKTIRKINSFNDNKGIYNKKNYRMFTEEELDKLYSDCLEYILDKFKTL